jgi:hypothetical protein
MASNYKEDLSLKIEKKKFSAEIYFEEKFFQKIQNFNNPQLPPKRTKTSAKVHLKSN